MIRIKRVYSEPSASDGVRILVDRVWPRGISKERAHIVELAKGCSAEHVASPMVRTRSRPMDGVSQAISSRAEAARPARSAQEIGSAFQPEDRHLGVQRSRRGTQPSSGLEGVVGSIGLTTVVFIDVNSPPTSRCPCGFFRLRIGRVGVRH